MVEILICVLILSILGVGAFYAAHYIVSLRHSRDTLADEYKRAEEHIKELEERVIMLESERDIQTAKMSPYRTEQTTGWDSMNIRS